MIVAGSPAAGLALPGICSTNVEANVWVCGAPDKPIHELLRAQAPSFMEVVDFGVQATQHQTAVLCKPATRRASAADRHTRRSGATCALPIAVQRRLHTIAPKQ